LHLRISINGHHVSTGEGSLGAHIYLNDLSGSGNPKMDILLSGYDTNDPQVTKCLKWPSTILEKGDLIEIEIMSKAPADEPSEIKTTSEGNKRT
jgi:hypothetical protein